MDIDIEHTRDTVLKALTFTDYRKSASTWAGGEHIDLVDVCGADLPSCSGRTYKAWSKNGKWRGSNSTHRFYVANNWVTTVYHSELEVIDGLLTLSARRIPVLSAPALYSAGARHIWEATWVEQSRGCSLKSVDGLIVELDLMDCVRMHITATSKHGRIKAIQRRIRAEAFFDQVRDAVPTCLSQAEADTLVTFADGLKVACCVGGLHEWVGANLPGRLHARLGSIVALDQSAGNPEHHAISQLIELVRANLNEWE